MAEGLNPTQQYNGREEKGDSLYRSDHESDAEGQVGSSSQSLKGSRPKKSAFQITSVVTKKEDNNHGADDADSQDELEESRLEEASSSELLDISNLSRASQNSEMDKSIIDDTVPSVSLPDRTIVPVDSVSTEEITSNDGTAETNGNGPSRFRVVKVPNPEPVKRGRWTCKDFPNEKNQGKVVQERSELGKESIHSGDSSTASSVHYVPGENSADPSGGATGEEKRSAKRSMSRQTSSRRSVLDDFVNSMMTGDESKTDDEDSATTAGAIDNKIEQAMDIVKGHLLMAVREEVEVLKEQISELLDANEKLRKENTMLRKDKGASNPASSQLLQHISTASSTQEFQGLTATQMHTTSSYHQHSLSGQQLPSSTSTGAPTEHYQPSPAHHHHPQSVESAVQPYQHIPDAQVVDQTYQHAIPSQPSTVTTNAEQYHPSAQGQQHQDGQYSLMSSQQGHPVQGTSPSSLTTSHPSQYQHPGTLGIPHTSSEQGQYQTVPQHHQLGASQEHSQAVPPTGAITRPQQGSQPRIPHSQGDRQL